MNVEPHAHKEDQVGLLHRKVPRARSEDPHSSGIGGVGRRQCVLRSGNDDGTAQGSDEAGADFERAGLTDAGTNDQ